MTGFEQDHSQLQEYTVALALKFKKKTVFFYIRK